ncbi:hypothetical protein ACUUL3_05900 [Thiovibrio sp. JS02]
MQPTTCRTLMVLCLPLLLAIGACATYTRQVVMRYEPVTSKRFAGGELYLVNSELQPPSSSGAWPIGTVKNRDGNPIDTLWSGVSPAGLVQTALSRELDKSGYQVLPQKNLPAGAEARVVEINEAIIELDQKTNISRVDGSCTISVAITVARPGAPARILRYKANSTDIAVKDRDRLAEEMLRNTMQDLMKQAMPDIVGTLAQ